ncbi:HalOD1 output domain-containing protein [Natrialbaceae archaeon A-CW3]
MTNRIAGGNRSRPATQRSYVRYERSDGEPLSIATAKAISIYRGESVTEASTPLYEYVDPDALDALFADKHDGTTRTHGSITVELPDVTVGITRECIDVAASDRGSITL